MKLVKIVVITWCLFTIPLLFGQDNKQPQQRILNPTELESAKLGKLKAQLQVYQLQSQILQLQYNQNQQQLQQKQSELLGQAQTVIEAHKTDKTQDWTGAIYKPNDSEDGVFVSNTEIKTDKTPTSKDAVGVKSK